MDAGTIDQLNFQVILDHSKFDDEIIKVENRAKEFNTSLSNSLTIQREVEKAITATAKASAKASAERNKDAQNFNKYLEQLRKMEENGQKIAETMPKAFNWTHHINQSYMELDRLMGILQKIQERLASGARIQYSDEYLNKITAAGEGALRAITALEQAQKRLTSPNNGFQEHIRNLTTTNTTLLQMRGYYAALEKDAQRAAKETEKMYGAQAKATKEASRQLPIGRTAEGLAAERAAIERRIAENIANESKEMSKVTRTEGTRASEAKKVAEAQQKVNRLIEEATGKQKKHTEEVKRTAATLSGTRNILSVISQLTGVYFGVAGIRRFLSSLIDITGQFEVQKMALRNMLQDVAAADRVFRQLYEFSSESTYRFSELAKYAKQLAAFQIGKDDLLETTKMLGDVASGVGVSMDRLILAYGHVKSSGFLRGIQLRSFSQNGIQILKELSDMLTEIEGKAVSMGDVFTKMTKREIDFSMVEEAFRRMTSEGGQFYQMQEVLAKTLAGQINILKGKWENALYAIGQSQDNTLKGTVKFLTAIVNHLQEIGAALKPVIVGFGAYGLALAGAAMGQWVVGAERAIRYFIILTQRTNLATAAVRVFGSTTKAVAVGLGALGAAIAVVVALVQATGAARREIDSFNKSLDELHKTARESNSVDKEVSEIESLYKVLKNTNNAYDSRKAALDRLKQIVPSYHADLTEEGRLINNNKSALDKYIDALNREAKMKGAQDELAALYKKRREVAARLEGAEASEQSALSAPTSANIATSTGYVFAATAMSLNKAKQDVKIIKTELDAVDAQIESVNKEIAETIGTGQEGPETYDVNAIVEGIKKTDKEIEKIRAKARKGSISAAEKEQLETLVQDRADQAKEYEDIMGVKYDKDTKAAEKHESEAEKIAKRQRKRITDEISLLEKYKSAYEKLEPFFGEETNSQLAKIFGGGAKDYEDLDETISELLDTLSGMGEEGKTSAESIAARLGLDEVGILIKRYNAAQKALEDYKRAFDKFDKDWGNGETGAAGKVGKALRDFNNENKKIDDEYVDAQQKAYEAHKDEVDIIAEETDKLYELYKARKKANDAKLKDSVTNLAEAIFKEQMQGFDLTNWNDKNLSQILEIRDALNDLKIPDSILFMLKDSPILLKLLNDELSKIKQKTLDNTVDPEVVKKWAKYGKQVASYISKAGDAMKKLGAATGDVRLDDVGEALSAIGQNLNAAAEGYQKSGSWIGAVVGGVIDIFNQVTDAMAKSREEMEKMEDTIRNIRTEAERGAFNDLLSSGTDGIFGDNFVRRVRNATNGLSLVNEKLRKADMALYEYKKHLFLDKRMSEPINSGLTGGEVPLITKHSFWGGDTFKTLQEIADEFGMELKDVNDNLNPTLLQKVLDTYGDLNKEAKDWLTNAIEYSEEYALAIKQIEDATKEVFDNLASDMTDKFIDNFLAMGNAVDDLSDTFADLGDAILRSFLQSYILDEILGEYEDEAKSMLTKYSKGQMTPDEYAAWLSEFAQNVQHESETLAPAINGMIAAFKDRGLMNIDSDTANSLGSGIKSITEDTANLLASYLNAMRADVSVMRGVQERNLPEIAGALPTLNDYLAQIAATNFDIAQSNQSILSEIQSVIGSPDTSGMVVRVQAV